MRKRNAASILNPSCNFFLRRILSLHSGVIAIPFNSPIEEKTSWRTPAQVAVTIHHRQQAVRARHRHPVATSTWQKIEAATFANSVDMRHRQPLQGHVRIAHIRSMSTLPRKAANMSANFVVMSRHLQRVAHVQKVRIKGTNTCSRSPLTRNGAARFLRVWKS